jgi:hypothetical protein
MVEDWAQEHDYELLAIRDCRSRDHAFADRFGSGFGRSPGIVKRVEMRARNGRVRRGWIFVKARLTAQGYSGFLPNSLEVAWQN